MNTDGLFCLFHCDLNVVISTRWIHLWIKPHWPRHSFNWAYSPPWFINVYREAYFNVNIPFGAVIFNFHCIHWHDSIDMKSLYFFGGMRSVASYHCFHWGKDCQNFSVCHCGIAQIQQVWLSGESCPTLSEDHFHFLTFGPEINHYCFWNKNKNLYSS